MEIIILLILLVLFISYQLNKEKLYPKKSNENFNGKLDGNYIQDSNQDSNQDLVKGLNQRSNEIDNNEIDNNDVIDYVITKGTQLPTIIMNDNKFLASTGEENIDELLTRKQVHRSNMNRTALDGKVRSTRAIYEKYFTSELDENDDRVWWSSEAQESENDYNPY